MSEMSHATAHPQPLADEQLKELAHQDLIASATFARVVSILMRSPTHKHYALADLEWLALPPVLLGQYALLDQKVEGAALPVPSAFALWAEVSKDVDVDDDSIRHRNKLVLVVLPSIEIVRDDHLRFTVDRGLAIVTLDVAVLGFHDAALGVGEVFLRFGGGIVSYRSGGFARFLAAFLAPLFVRLGFGFALLFRRGLRFRLQLGLRLPRRSCVTCCVPTSVMVMPH